jgi:hypothetical protein
MTKNEYKKLLESDYWRGYSYAIIKERNWTCEQCGKYIPYARNEFNVHHKQYINDRKPWQYDADLLQVLCKECHAKVHNKYNNAEFNTISKNALSSINRINDKYNADKDDLSISGIVTVFILMCFIFLGVVAYFHVHVVESNNFTNKNNDDTITTNQIENTEAIKSDNKETFIDIISKPIKWIM